MSVRDKNYARPQLSNEPSAPSHHSPRGAKTNHRSPTSNKKNRAHHRGQTSQNHFEKPCYSPRKIEKRSTAKFILIWKPRIQNFENAIFILFLFIFKKPLYSHLPNKRVWCGRGGGGWGGVMVRSQNKRVARNYYLMEVKKGYKFVYKWV